MYVYDLSEISYTTEYGPTNVETSSSVLSKYGGSNHILGGQQVLCNIKGHGDISGTNHRFHFVWTQYLCNSLKPLYTLLPLLKNMISLFYYILTAYNFENKRKALEMNETHLVHVTGQVTGHAKLQYIEV